MGDGVRLSFAVDPAGAGRISADGADVTGGSLAVPQGGTVRLLLTPSEGYALENWNRGEWFDPEWDYRATADATITAYMR